jgi:NADH-quinone oxidoreductase subunit G
VSVVHATDDDLLMPIANKSIVAPSAWASALAELGVAVAEAKQIPAPIQGTTAGENAKRIATSLLGGKRKAILLGNAAMDHPQAAQLHAWAQWLAAQTGATFGILGAAANSVGGYLANAVPGPGGLNARTMIEQPRKAYLLWNLEPEYDCANPAAAMRALDAADTVIAFSSFRNGALEYADVILPIAPFTETSGTFVNCEGRVQPFNGVVTPLGDARPGWKVLRVIANAMGVQGFEYDNPESIRAQAVPSDVTARLSNQIEAQPQPAGAATGAIERLADVSIYAVDPIVRRSEPLQKTRDARPPKASANGRTLAKLGLRAGDKTRVRQGEASALLECMLDDRLADNVVRIPAGDASTSTLGAMFGPVTLEKA